MDERRRRIGYAARRELIAAAATEVFAECGYHGAALEEIARRAGITKPVLYDHFPSKRELHLALLAEERDRLLAHVRPRLEGEPGEAGVAAALEAFFSWVEERPYAWRMLFRDTTGEPDIAAAHERIRAEAHEAVVGALLATPAARRALGRRGPEAQGAAAAVVGNAVNGLALWWRAHPDVPRDAVVSVAMDVLWVGLERVRAGRVHGERR